MVDKRLKHSFPPTCTCAKTEILLAIPQLQSRKEWYYLADQDLYKKHSYTSCCRELAWSIAGTQ